MSATIESSDQALIELFRNEGPHSIEGLVEKVGVTATAIRHRLNRLMASGLIERGDVKSGRGRPSHQYKLSKQGFQSAGNNLGDLASAIWDEVQNIPDESVRRSIMSGVAERMAKLYSEQIQGVSTADRLASVAELFGKKKVPFIAEEQDGSTVLKIVGCPYPELTNDNHEICEMEKELLSKLANTQLTISQNACDCGGNCCTFEAIKPEVTNTEAIIPSES